MSGQPGVLKRSARVGPRAFQVAARVSHLISLVASTRNILIFQFGSSQDFWKKVVEETCELQPGTQR
jgi:hypothetical protein